MFRFWNAIFMLGLSFLPLFALAGGESKASGFQQCEIVALYWEFGVEPFDVSITDQTGRRISHHTVQQRAFNWTVTSNPGTQVKFTVTDVKGSSTSGGPYNVIRGITNCLHGTPRRSPRLLPGDAAFANGHEAEGRSLPGVIHLGLGEYVGSISVYSFNSLLPQTHESVSQIGLTRTSRSPAPGHAPLIASPLAGLVSCHCLTTTPANIH
ncbi:uncharacterized protein EI90DRAFT_2250431 [Cantharellus anzutake]|uniref:uncharacterized protein n=1 Tax=Cantharellus anzutake TaxID=1750568 RepID=UPI0019043A76|nr:uncharacterized protein EI90DRAFT_2250431 [Cantharellus anzutake]KAF8339545.1 hypothetical protein EI90DRAFT_2250431 [Cantharellus anzutake]